MFWNLQTAGLVELTLLEPSHPIFIRNVIVIEWFKYD